MKTTLAILAAAALALGAAGGASAQKLDKNGRCHDAKGHFAAMSVCKGAQPAKPEHCRDAKSGKFAKCGAPGAVAAPEKGAAQPKTPAHPKK